MNRKTTEVLPRVILWACSGQVLDIQGGWLEKFLKKSWGKGLTGAGSYGRMVVGKTRKAKPLTHFVDEKAVLI